MFLGWHDPDRRKSLERKLDDALTRYRIKFQTEPVTVLTSIADAEPLRQAAAERNLFLRGVRFVPASTFYVGAADEAHRAIEQRTDSAQIRPSVPSPKTAPTRSRRSKHQP